MQIQQNLFSIYRLILKLPYFLLLGMYAIFILLLITQIGHITTAPRHVDLSGCFAEYLQLNNQNATSEEETQPSKNIVLDKSNFSVQFLNATVQAERVKQEIKQVQLVSVNKLLHIRVGQVDKCTIERNYEYSYGQSSLPMAVLISNEQLAHFPKKSKEYLHKHKISYDLITLPPIDIKQPFFELFPQQQHQLNQYIVYSTLRSLSRINFHLMADSTRPVPPNNTLPVPPSNATLPPNPSNSSTTQLLLKVSDLFMIYFYEQPEGTMQHKINLVSELSILSVPSLFLKLFYLFVCFAALYLCSIFIGLVLRYIVILLLSCFLFAYDRCMSERWGWVNQYLRLLYMRFQQDRMGTFKLIFFYILATLGTYALLVFGLYCVISKLILPILFLQPEPYTHYFFKILFLVQIYHFICCRSRTIIRFFPICSFLVSYVTLILSLTHKFVCGIQLININFTLQLSFFVLFLIIEKYIYEQNQKGFIGDYCPSISKPRMLFYAGYDISWEQTLPPIWTYFTTWFDYSYFNECERSLLEKDYQLLYGRMLGLAQRQEIPEEEGEQRDHLRHHEQPSNEMNLIQE